MQQRQMTMSTAIRLSDDLVREAESEAMLYKRTTPKQLEYWAEIGKLVARTASSEDLLYLMEDLAEIRIRPRHAMPVNADAVFATVEAQRDSGVLSSQVTQARVRYEASTDRPGLLDRITPDGQRQSGRFRDGEFIPVG